MARGRPAPPQSVLYSSDGSLMPIPDPTKLTTEAVARAAEQFSQQLVTLREILEAQIQGAVESGHLRMAAIEKYTNLLADNHPQIRSEMRDQNTHLEQVNSRIRDEVKEEIRHVREIITGVHVELREEIRHDREIVEEKFRSVELQFTERDIRNDRQVLVTQQALSAALDTARLLSSQQAQANAVAAEKSETSFTKQLDQIGVQIRTLEKALNDRITEVKERIGRGEGVTKGTQHAVSETRLNAGQLVAVIAVIAVIANVLLVAFKK